MTRYIRSKSIDNLTILIDDREKKPWKLEYQTKVKRLKVGDYTFEGYEDLVAIEKKSGLVELLNDLAFGYRPTFKRFLARMKDHPIRCIVVEESLDYHLVLAGLKQIRKKSNGKSKLTPRTVYFWVGEIMLQYGIPILFVCKSERERVLREVFRAAKEQLERIK